MNEELERERQEAEEAERQRREALEAQKAQLRRLEEERRAAEEASKARAEAEEAAEAARRFQELQVGSAAGPRGGGRRHLRHGHTPVCPAALPCPPTGPGLVASIPAQLPLLLF